jgi:hypothetical protein
MSSMIGAEQPKRNKFNYIELKDKFYLNFIDNDTTYDICTKCRDVAFVGCVTPHF